MAKSKQLLRFDVEVSETFAFLGERSICLASQEELATVPRKPGVYLLHHGELISAWGEGRVFYIGGTFREKLRVRAGKHRKALLGQITAAGAGGLPERHAMRVYGTKIGHDLSDLFISYCALAEDVKDDIPFLLELVVLGKFRGRFGCIPEANKGSR